MLALIVTKFEDVRSALFAIGIGSLAVVTALDPSRGALIGTTSAAIYAGLSVADKYID